MSNTLSVVLTYCKCSYKSPKPKIKCFINLLKGKKHMGPIKASIVPMTYCVHTSLVY